MCYGHLELYKDLILIDIVLFALSLPWSKVDRLLDSLGIRVGLREPVRLGSVWHLL